MIIYFYSLIPLLLLPVEPSSIRDRNFRNDLVPFLSSRLDSSKKDANSLKIVSNEPFIIQLQMPNPGESTRKANKEKDTKRKRPIKKRVSKLKPLRKRHRQRRDLQPPKIDLDSESKLDELEISKTGKAIEHQSENATKNTISRADMLKTLSSYTKKRETKKRKKDVKNFQQDEEKGSEMAEPLAEKAPDSNIQRSSPLVKMVYPSAPKTDKPLHKYSYKDLMSDRERLEKKIKYIKNMMNLSTADDAIRVRRRSESDRTANKIAKMFLTLSAVNGLHDKLKSRCDEDDDGDVDNEDGYHFWGKENQEHPVRRSLSSNEERYKVKKWIEHLKSKRTSSKTCPCMVKENDDDRDVFPLERKLPKNYYNLQRGGVSEESSETYGNPSYYHRDKPHRISYGRRRNHKGREDQESRLKALSGKSKKLELPLDDLELYRMKAKQILQNAEEILDKIKDEEERRISTPNILVNQLKELTSRIQPDPRNNENDLIRKLHKNLELKPSDGSDGSGFLEKVKSFILDPYEKAKALTDESAKKLSSYLLRNLGDLQESGERKEDGEHKVNPEVYFGQVPQKEEEKPYPENLAKEKPDDRQTKSKEDAQPGVSSVPDDGDNNKKNEELRAHSEDQFRKRMEEIIKEQEKKLNGFEMTQESGESEELPDRTGSKKEQGETGTVKPKEVLKEHEAATPLQEKKEEVFNSKPDKKAKSDLVRDHAPTESDYISEKEAIKKEKENAKAKSPKKDKVDQKSVKEISGETEKNEERVQSEIAPGYKESSLREAEKDEEYDPVEAVQEKSNGQKEAQEVVAAGAPEEQEAGVREASNANPKGGYRLSYLTEVSDEDSSYESDEKTGAKKPEYSKENGSFEERVSNAQEELESEPDPEKISISSSNTGATVGSNDPTLSTGESKKQTDQNNQEEIPEEMESRTGKESPRLSKESDPDDSVGKVKSNEEKEAEINEEKEEEEEGTLRLDTPAEGHERRVNDKTEENADNETPDEKQLSKAALDSEDQVGVGAKSDNSDENFDERKKEVLVDREENLTDESPLVSAKESSKEISSRQDSGEYDVEAFQDIEEPAEDANNKGGVVKAAKDNVEDTQYSGEDTTPLKTAMNDRSNEKEAEVNEDDKTVGMAANSEEKILQNVENSGGNKEALLESALDKSPETDKHAGVNLEAAKSLLDVLEKDLESFKKKDSGEVVSEEEKEENLEEGEKFRLKATGASRDLDKETQNKKSDGESDDISKDGNSDEREDTLSRAPGGQDSDNLNDRSEEIPIEKSSGVRKPDGDSLNGDAGTSDGTLKASLKEKDGENVDDGDTENDSSRVEESHEELKMIQDLSQDEADEKDEEVEATLDDRVTDNGDNDEKISLKPANNKEESNINLNKNEENGEPSLQVTLDTQDRGMMGGIDDDAKKREGDENNDDDPVIENINKDPQRASKDDTPLKAVFENEDLVTEEVEENQNKSEGINEDTPLRETSSKKDEEIQENADVSSAKASETRDDSESSEEADESPLGATINKDEEETLDDADEISLKASITRNDEETLEDADENPLKAVRIKDDEEETLEDADGTPLKATRRKDDDAETPEDADEISLKSNRYENNEETPEDITENSLKATRTKDDDEETPEEDVYKISLKANRNEDNEKTPEDTDENPLKATRNKNKEETSEEADESPLKATRRKGDDEETSEETDENPLKANRNDNNEETPENADENPLKATRRKGDDEETPEDSDEISLKSNRNEDNEAPDTDEIPLKATRTKDDDETFEDADDISLKANIHEDDEETPEDIDGTPLKAVNIDGGRSEKGDLEKGRKKTFDTNDVNDDGVETPENEKLLREENSKKSPQENGSFYDKNPLRAEKLEEFNNLYEDEETPLRASNDDSNRSGLFKNIDKGDSEGRLREMNIPDDFSNQIDGRDEDETPLKSVNSFDEAPEGYEDDTLKKENPSGDSGESEDRENYSSPTAAERSGFQKTGKGIPSGNLQQLHSRGSPLKANSLKVPTSIARIMKDLEGPEKEDLSTIENLNPAKIDYIIDKMDEVEQQNKVTDEVDCRKECACAEGINTRSRIIGRYEIAKDFLRWMKDLQLNRVLSDD